MEFDRVIETKEENWCDKFRIVQKIYKYFLFGITVVIITLILNKDAKLNDLLILAFAVSATASVIDLSKLN